MGEILDHTFEPDCTFVLQVSIALQKSQDRKFTLATKNTYFNLAEGL